MNSDFTEKQFSWATLKNQRSVNKFSSLILRAYKYSVFRKISFSLALRLEGGVFFSSTIRRILEDYHGVTVGAYSYGPCLVPGLLPRGTIVGAYCSLAEGLKVFRRNHPIDYLSQHPFFYNSMLGLVYGDTIIKNEDNPLQIGNDVWIGDGVSILPGCRFIGDGAVIGAGSVVTKSVDPYTVVAGNPARTIKRRYDDGVVRLLQESKWWELPLTELLNAGNLLTSSINHKNLSDFLLSQGLIE